MTATKFSRRQLLKLSWQFVAASALATTQVSCMGAYQVQPAVPASIADGQVLGVAPGTVMYGLNQVFAEVIGTKTYLSPNGQLVLFSWPIKGMGQAWVQMQNTWGGFQSFIRATEGGRGSIANLATWANLESYLVGGNWKLIAPIEASTPLIVEIATTITGAVAVSSLTSIFVVPLVSTDLQDWIDGMLNPNSGPD